MAVEHSAAPRDGRRPEAATAAPQLRLRQADREAAAERLKEAYADGRLEHDEFEQRLELAMRAKVARDLEPLLEDVAARPGQSEPVAAGSPEPTREERLWALGSHLSGYPTSCVGPLVVLLLQGRTSPFVRRQALEALNYQLIFLIFSVLLPVVAIVTLGLGFIVYLFALLGWFVLPATAAFAAALGMNWRYPVTPRLLRDR